MADKKQLLQQAGELLESSIQERIKENKFREERENLVERVSKELSSSFKPLLEEIKEGIKSAIASVKIEAPYIPPIEIPEVKVSPISIQIPKVEIPEIKLPIINIPEIKLPIINVPEIKIPEIKLPTINVPKPEVTINIPPIKIPEIQMPEEMNIKGWVSLMGVDLNNPLPVQLRDAKGNPIHLFENLTQILNGGGGGKHDFFTIKGFSQSAFAEIIN